MPIKLLKGTQPIQKLQVKTRKLNFKRLSIGKLLKILPTITDNITDVLMKIVEFTNQRRNILTQNILEVDSKDFVPKDLDVSGFADLMATAISEHLKNERLLLRDTDNVRFGNDGNLDTTAVIDPLAGELLKTDRRKYLEYQVERLSENLVNNKFASELLKQKQGREQQEW